MGVEHALTDQVQWNGERGKTYMFQCELPYDVTEANFGAKGYTGYRVAEHVRDHAAWGVGVYHFFRDHPVTVNSGIVVPDHLVRFFEDPLACYLSGKGSMNHIINNIGDATVIDFSAPKNANPRWLCQNMPPLPVPAPTSAPVPGPATPAPTQPPTCKPCNTGTSYMCHVRKCQGTWPIAVGIDHSFCRKWQNADGFTSKHCTCDKGYCWDANRGNCFADDRVGCDLPVFAVETGLAAEDDSSEADDFDDSPEVVDNSSLSHESVPGIFVVFVAFVITGAAGVTFYARHRRSTTTSSAREPFLEQNTIQ